MSTNLNWLAVIKPYFPTAYVYKDDELIVEPKNNIYFRIDNVKNNKEFSCKILEWCSRSACKCLSNYWQRYMLRGINSYFGRDFAKTEMELIYTKLGNNVNRKLCENFIDSGLDLNVLTKD